MQRRTKIRTVLVGVIISWSLAIGWYSARVLPQEDLESIYALEQSANARLLTDYRNLEQKNEQDQTQLVAAIRGIFKGVVALYDGVISERTENPVIEPLPFSDFDAFVASDRDSQLFYISGEDEFPRAENCYNVLNVPKSIRRELDGSLSHRGLSTLWFRCYIKDGRSYMGHVWRFTSKNNRKHIYVKRITDAELAVAQDPADRKEQLSAFLSGQTETLKRFPSAMQAVLDGHRVLVSSDALAPLSLSERFFKEGQNSGEVDTLSGSLLVATTVREDGLTAITAVPKGDTQAKYYALAAFAVLGGLLIAAALLILGRWEDRRRS